MKTRKYIAIHKHGDEISIYPFKLPVNKSIPSMEKLAELLNIDYEPYMAEDLDYLLIEWKDVPVI